MANTNKGFDVHGDEITFTGIPFATINGRANASQRAEAESELIHGPDGWVSEDEHNSRMEAEFTRGRQDYKDDAEPLRLSMVAVLEDAADTLEAGDDPDHKALIGQIRAIIKKSNEEACEC